MPPADDTERWLARVVVALFSPGGTEIKQDPGRKPNVSSRNEEASPVSVASLC